MYEIEPGDEVIWSARTDQRYTVTDVSGRVVSMVDAEGTEKITHIRNLTRATTR